MIKPVAVTVAGEFRSLVAHALRQHARTFGRPEDEPPDEMTEKMRAAWIKNRDELNRLAGLLDLARTSRRR
jgi:hypothetical protein